MAFLPRIAGRAMCHCIGWITCRWLDRHVLNLSEASTGCKFSVGLERVLLLGFHVVPFWTTSFWVEGFWIKFIDGASLRGEVPLDELPFVVRGIPTVQPVSAQAGNGGIFVGDLRIVISLGEQTVFAEQAELRWSFHVSSFWTSAVGRENADPEAADPKEFAVAVALGEQGRVLAGPNHGQPVAQHPEPKSPSPEMTSGVWVHGGVPYHGHQR